MLVASVGLFAGNAPQQKKHDKKPEIRECAPLCHPNPKMECDSPWNVSAAATYQQVSVQAGEVGILTNDRSNTAFPVGGIGIEPVDNFAWGFQVGAGYTSPEDYWTLGINYNYFKSISNTCLEVSYGQAFVPSAYANQRVDGADTAPVMFNNLQSGTYMLFNNVEFLANRATMITPNLEITTLFGIDAQFMTRRQLSVFTNGLTDSLAPYTTASTGYISNFGGYFQNYQKFMWWGVGPELGVHTNWDLGNCFSFFGDAFGSLTYGSAYARTATFSKVVNGVQNGAAFGFTAAEAAVENSQYQFSPAVKYLLGFSWSKIMDNTDSKVTLRIAYSSEYFFYLMKTVVPEASFQTANGAGFGIQGLILNAGYEF